MAQMRAAVVGGGLAGLACAMRIAEAGGQVDLFSIVPVKRSHSVCAQGGINAAVNTKGEGDSTWQHFIDTCKGGAFLCHQPPVKGMADEAPGVIYMLDRMGVTFNRTAEGLLDFRRFGGTLHHRTAYAGATTGQQLLYALDEQVRRYETEGLITKYEGWEFIGVIQDGNGRCVGMTAQNLKDMSIRSFPAGAVVLATGGPGLVFGRTTNSVVNHGSAASAVVAQGAHLANGEFVQIHPTAIPGEDKLRLMSESARGEGGRVWVPAKKRPDGSWAPFADAPSNTKLIPVENRYFFLEERYPAYGNLVPRDIATREILKAYQAGMGVNGKPMVYLDLTHKDPEWLKTKLGGILEIYEKFRGVDARFEPMLIFPAVHYVMGGLWCDFTCDPHSGGMIKGDPRNQQTNIPGLYAVGEADYQYHGANRLGANSLLSCIWSGMQTGQSVFTTLKAGKDEPSAKLYEDATRKNSDHFKDLAGMTGTENAFRIHEEFGELMTSKMTILRENGELKQVLDKIHEYKDRFKRINALDTSPLANQALPFLRQLHGMLMLGEIMTRGALERNECRGAHYKPYGVEQGKKVEFENDPQELKDTPVDSPEWDAFHARFELNDTEWLKTTIASVDSEGNVALRYAPVDLRHLSPQPRDYTGQGKKAWAEWLKTRRAAYWQAKNIPPPLPYGQREYTRADGTKGLEVDPAMAEPRPHKPAEGAYFWPRVLE
ncbi:MAG: succinate dehydrogenase flavoprotein subunit [Planctomycetota bacterium]